MRPRSVARAALLLVLSGSGVALGWGGEAHHRVNELALGALPDGPLADVLREDGRAVVLAGSLPDDVWRHEYKKVESERHFFEIDQLAPPPYASLPTAVEAMELCEPKGPDRLGRLPVAVSDLYHDLVHRLRRGDRAGARRTAGALGHFVADATMPLHATKNFDGWLTGNKGIHFLIEVTFHRWAKGDVEALLAKERLVPDRAGRPEDVTIELLREGIAFVPELMAIDARARWVSGPMDGRDPEELRPWTPIVARQLARAACALQGLWLQAEREWQAPSRSSP